MHVLNVSVNLLQYTNVNFENNTEPQAAFYYDANLDYFGWPHAAYGVLAIVCLLVFVLPPLTVLLFYHLKIFQRCLSWCKLDRPGLHALVDAYQGCFKNSATDGVERRYFAGIYFLFRLYILFAIFSSSFSNLKFIIQLSLSIVLLMAGTLSLLRPYKKTAHNVIDFLVFLFMPLIFSPFLPITYSNHDVLVAAIFIHMIPVFALICYLIYRFFKWLCCTVVASSCRRHQPVEEEGEADEHQPLLPPTRSEVDLTDYTLDDLFPDRVLNPNCYNYQQ